MVKGSDLTQECDSGFMFGGHELYLLNNKLVFAFINKKIYPGGLNQHDDHYHELKIDNDGSLIIQGGIITEEATNQRKIREQLENARWEMKQK